MLESGHDMGDGIVEGGAAIEIRLPEAPEQLEVIVPATLVQPLTDRVRCVAGIMVCGAGLFCEHWLNDFAGGVKDQRVPQIAGDGFLALAASADDGLLNGFGDSVRGFVEEDFE